MRSRGVVAVGSGWALALTFGAAMSWFQVFPAQDIGVQLLLAAVLPVVASGIVLAGVRKRAALSALVAGVVVASLLAAVVAARDGTSIVSAPIDGLLLNWQRLLTVPLMVPANSPFLLVPVMVVGVAGSATVLAVGRPGWLLFTPPALVWISGTVMGVNGPMGILATSLPVVLVVLARLATAQEDGVGAVVPATVRVLGVTAMAGVVGVLAAAPVSSIFRATPLDPRGAVQPPQSIDNMSDPLDQLSAQLSATSADPAFRLRTSATGAISPFALLTTYDEYNGSSWHVGGSAVPASSSIQSASDGRSNSISEQVEGSAFTSPWVPHTGQVSGVDTPGVLVFPGADVLVDPQAATRQEYDLTVTAPLDNPAIPVRVGTTDNSELLRVECLPAAFSQGMAAAAAGAAGPVAKAVAVQQWLETQSGLTVAREAPAGHSCSRLEQLTLPDQDRRVNSEQLATLLTLGVRAEGVPARLAYGYRLGTPGPDGVYAPPASNAVAYTQILVDPIGWVSVDAAPAEAPSVASTTTDVPAVEQEVQVDVGDKSTDDPGLTTAPPGNTIPWQIVVAIAVIAAAVIGVLGWLAWAARRRRRARAAARALGDPRAQQLAAWVEALAALVRAGIPVRTGTFSEIVAYCTDRPGVSEPLSELAQWAERAMFDPRPSAADLGVNAFTLSDFVTAGLASGRTRRQRLAMLFDQRTPAEIVASAPAVVAARQETTADHTDGLVGAHSE